MIPKIRFAAVVREIVQEELRRRGKSAVDAASIHIEADAITALQQMSEHLLNDVFQMAYLSLIATLTF